MVIIDKNNFKTVEQKKEELSRISTKPLHFIYQTKNDFKKNIKKRDKPILSIIEKGAVLWGQKLILESIEDGSQ